MALRCSLPRGLLILAEEQCLIQTTFGAPMEFVSAVLSDCFPVQIWRFAGYFGSFLFDRKNAIIVRKGQIIKGPFSYGRVEG